MNFLILSRLQQGAKIFASTVGQVKANGNQCRRLSQRIDYVIEDILKKSDVLHQYPETIKTLERLESIIQQCQDFIKEFTNDLTWYKKIFYHQNYKDQFASLNQQIEQCTKDLHLSISLQSLFNRKEDENDQQKDMNEIHTKLDEIVQLMVRQQESIENLLNKQYASFRHHLDQNLRKTTDVRVAQTIEQQIQHFLPIPFYDLRVEKCIGQGGFADVYRGVWLSQQHEVAIKIIRVTHLTDSVTQEFMREIHIMHKIRCDHVLNVFGACMEPQVYALVIEYMELGSLFDVLQKKKIQFTWPDRWSIALQMVKGINYLHHLQPPVVHRDIKSLNFLLKEGARQQFLIKVGDFGLADIRKETIRQTNCNSITPPSTIGTVQWLAPELFAFGRPTLASDVFALAVVFWELVTGLIPYEHSNESVIRLAVCHGDRLVIPAEIPDQFRDIITRAWAQDPNTRSTCPMIIDAITLSILNINEHQMDSSPLVDHHEVHHSIKKDNSNNSLTTKSHSGNRFTDIELENKRLPACYGYLNYKLLSLEDAMKELQDVLEDINRFVKLAKKHCTYPNEHNLTKDESAAIYIYTMEMTDDSSVYRILNQTLRADDRTKVRPWFGYLKLLDSATSKLPKFEGTVWRGINKDVTMNFKKGQRITWWSISSCSTSADVISSFISKSSSSTLFNIECLNGKSVSSYTCYPNENDVILMPGTIFEVVSNPLSHPGGPNIIHLKEITDDEEPPRSSNPQQIQREKSKFQQLGITVAGGNDDGPEFDQLSYPQGIFIDNDKSLYIADSENHRIVKWKLNSNTGEIIIGENGKGNQNNQLNEPRDIIYDKENNSFIISDAENKRVIRYIIQNQQTRLPSIIRYFIQNQTNEQIIISNIKCWGLTIDKNGFIYVSDCENHEVRRWKQGDEKGELVAGGNGQGKQLNQLNKPTFIFINGDYTLYISDTDNHRVMKWKKDAKEGIIVAGGNDKGNSFKQLSYPRGVIVDHLGQIYVADCGNHRIVRWCEGDREGKIVVGGNDKGNQSNQLHYPKGLSFDNEGNLYVVDEENHRIQKYEKLIN
ncbi:unnamed protein product [Adineta steineri]|uniref:NAD(P)(+)--arginine ADP-ribosyltransferase n=1 Tax=Adineta steineri TaxID=433720 RepID=A0A818RNS8_9BILA|nr:unnamed protein product [Adineta steineri]CAF3660864.1 unnamed protein product [Adineta steineri]